MKHDVIALDKAAEKVASKHPLLAALESGLERFLFASRWLMAPFYLLMVGALALSVVLFKVVPSELKVALRASCREINVSMALVRAFSFNCDTILPRCACMFHCI